MSQNFKTELHNTTMGWKFTSEIAAQSSQFRFAAASVAAAEGPERDQWPVSFVSVVVGYYPKTNTANAVNQHYRVLFGRLNRCCVPQRGFRAAERFFFAVC